MSLPACCSGGAVYLLSKAPGITSRRAAGRVAAAWGVKKHGHAGTLDPDASGVLPVLLGKATRLSPYLTGHDKTYRFSLVLGTSTDTGDSSGRVLLVSDPCGIGEADVLKALQSFTGSFDQRVPEFSALRVGGVRAYEMARTGLPAVMPVRKASATNWILHSMDGRNVSLEVTVGAGTYIRALARDIGEVLGTGAHATGICRTSVGSFTVERCSVEPDEPASLLSPAEAMDGFPSLALDEDGLLEVGHGGSIRGSSRGTIAMLAPDGRLVAVGRGDGARIHPVTVLEAS